MSALVTWARSKVDILSTRAGWAGCPPYGLVVLCAAALWGAAPAHAVEVPSGQPIELHEVLVDDMGTQTWLRFRFVAPQIARKGGTVTYEKAGPDMDFLCTTLALPYIAEYKLEGEMIVISLADRKTEFGVADPDATQFFEAYRPVDNSCIWEEL